MAGQSTHTPTEVRGSGPVSSGVPSAWNRRKVRAARSRDELVRGNLSGWVLTLRLYLGGAIEIPVHPRHPEPRRDRQGTLSANLDPAPRNLRRHRKPGRHG
jgi:hypothetical protein